MIPVFPAIIGNAHAVVIAKQYVIGILGVDPERMVIATKPERSSVPFFSSVSCDHRRNA